MTFYKKRRIDTEEAVKEFEKKTGLKIIKAVNCVKGSMKRYIYFLVQGNNIYEEINNKHYDRKDGEKHLLNGLEITFVNRILGKTWNDTNNDQVGIHVVKNSFQEVNWVGL